ncbi:barwin-like endoglucanase [Delitschia confertaspora ATCC 74209]|uniref:Barwin-like endoglucanase n=1 Tax=Delitschia confertaspora ATCC 74209 TaxID=1513339 RepID=A0A9P4MWH9_9PLEO|nr:barwin-like endoglucanase [Delitschia confertaspora ATCC 74209]
MTATAANDVARVPTSARPVIESPSPESPIESSSSAPTVPQSLSTASNPAADSTSTITATNKGEATFYGGNVSGGMCSFSTYSIPSGLFGTALSDFNWNSAGNCGACVSVTGPNGNSVKAMIVDQCPNCGPNHLDLFPDAFAKLADPSKGVIPVEWAIVPCGITSPLILHNKSGTSKYWFSMQVVNANIPVSKLEISTDGGKTWQATTRKEYNFFENPSGFGTETVDVRVTSTSGQAIVVKKVGVASGSSVTAGSNFS